MSPHIQNFITISKKRRKKRRKKKREREREEREREREREKERERIASHFIQSSPDSNQTQTIQPNIITLTNYFLHTPLSSLFLLTNKPSNILLQHQHFPFHLVTITQYNMLTHACQNIIQIQYMCQYTQHTPKKHNRLWLAYRSEGGVAVLWTLLSMKLILGKKPVTKWGKESGCATMIQTCANEVVREVPPRINLGTKYTLAL